jgi:VWFA-related protein
MRRVMSGVVGILVAGVALAAQQQAPVFRGGVTVVRVDATVLDHDGKPVVDLKAGEFEIKINGQTRTVRTAVYEHVGQPATASIQPASISKPTREVSNNTPAAEPRLVVMMLDDLSIAPSRGKGMFFAATKFVDALPATDVVGFTTTSRTSMLNPTTNRAAIDAALRHTVGEFIDTRDAPPQKDVPLQDAVDIMEGDQSKRLALLRQLCGGFSSAAIETTDCAHDVDQKVRLLGGVAKANAARQIQALIDTLDAMRVAPGLKELVIISDGLAVAQRLQLEKFQPVARAAAAAGVHLNVMSQDPDQIDLAKGGHAYYADDRDRVFGLMSLTDLAGGTFYRVMGQPDRFFGFVADATSGIYHLGVEVPSNIDTKKDFTVSAHVSRPDLTVRANHVANLPETAVTVPVMQRLNDAVTKGLSNYGVPLTLGMALRRGGAPGTVEIGATVEIPASAEAPLMVTYGLLDQAGRVQIGRETIANAPTTDSYRLSLSLPVAQGNYRLRFAVADASGRIGSLDAAVVATLPVLGALTTSDVVLSWSNATTKPRFLALSEVPTAATSLQGYLELYAATDRPAPADVRVRWTVIGPTGPRPGEQTVLPVASAGRLTAAIQIPLDSLPPGEYDLQATVLIGTTPVGAVTSTFRKAAADGRMPLDWWLISAATIAAGQHH